MKNLRFIFVLLVLFSSGIFAQNIIQVPAGTDGINAAYTTAISGDIIELTSDGGLYIETTMLIVDGKEITIRAASGLVNKPVWACTAVSAYGGIMQISSSVTVDGIIMDGTGSTPATVNGIITEGVSGTYNIKVSNSTLKNFKSALYGSGGATQVDSVVFSNCLFENFTDNAIIFYQGTAAPATFKYLSVTNSTFWNPVFQNIACIYTQANDALYSPLAGFTPDPIVVIDHVTIYNFRRLYCKQHTNVQISNSIFTATTSSNGFVLYGDHTGISSCMYNNVSNSFTDGVIQTNLLNADPLFKDAPAGDFTITAASPAYNTGNDGKSLGDPRWWSIDVPEFIFLAAGENVISSALASAVDGQTFVLTSDGGIYNETAKLIIDKNIKIKAGDDLTHRPTLTSGSTDAMIEISADFLLKGVILDGSLGGTLTAIGITNKPNTSGYDLTVLESDFLNFADAANSTGFGIFGHPSSVIDSVFIQYCYFAHILDMGISFNDPLTPTGSVNHFKVDNSTFWNMNSEAIYVDGNDSNVTTKDPQFNVNKVTVYDCGSYNIIPHYIDSAVISNSIVVLPTLNTSYAPAKLYGSHSKIENFLYFNTRDIDLSSGATDFQLMNLIIQQDPLFKEASAGDFTISETSPAYNAGTDGKSLGDDRWWPVSEYIYVAAGENAISQALSAAVSGQTIVLTTDGGIYNETAKLIIDKAIMIKVADGLEQRPTLTSGSTDAMIEISADFLLKGVILNGSLGGTPTAIGITNKPNTSGYDLTVLESDFLNFADATNSTGFGIFGHPGSVIDSVFIQDCYFGHIVDMGISFNDPLTPTGSVNHFKVDNSTFWDMNSEAIYVDGNDSNVTTKDPDFNVNKVTVYNCGSYNIIPHYIDSAVISNSIVVLPTLNTSYAPAKLYGSHSKIENFLYFNTRDIDLSSGATDFQLINLAIQQNPLFSDAEAGLFFYPSNSPAIITGDGGVQILLGDDRWWPGISTGIEDDNSATNNKFQMLQNYPNPFNAQTKITYNVPVSGKVVIKVYDVYGKEVNTLINKEQRTGKYEVDIDASSLAGGIYYYRIQSGSFDQTRKMILIK